MRRWPRNLQSRSMPDGIEESIQREGRHCRGGGAWQVRRPLDRRDRYMIEVKTKASIPAEPDHRSAPASRLQSASVGVHDLDGGVDARSAAGNMSMQSLFRSGAIQAKL